MDGFVKLNVFIWQFVCVWEWVYEHNWFMYYYLCELVFSGWKSDCVWEWVLLGNCKGSGCACVCIVNMRLCMCVSLHTTLQYLHHSPSWRRCPDPFLLGVLRSPSFLSMEDKVPGPPSLSRDVLPHSTVPAGPRTAPFSGGGSGGGGRSGGEDRQGQQG